MKSILASFFLSLLAGAPGIASTAAEQLKEEIRTYGEAAFVSPDYKPALVRHIVLFRYTDSTTRAQKQALRSAAKAWIKS